MISKLEWNITAVTAFDYVDQILERVKWGSDDSRLREHAHTLIHVCSTGKLHQIFTICKSTKLSQRSTPFYPRHLSS